MRGSNGFSLIEIIVALTIAAILSISFLGVQRQSALMAQSSKDSWDVLNMSQDILGHKYPDGMSVVSSGWIPWPGPPAGDFRVKVESISSVGVGFYSLQTRSGEYTLDWNIYRVSHKGRYDR
ncbi:prepilin-type N-terminal cleavage/methylation domain-containing protein [Maridesulfovibrio sp.]|uniref:prepilin-type N-terminal cleavage/methylation domain-containing protein n=1 Tax=Maridesulfovibrio sp. TaxID=2795000 RepID=UPI002A18D09B|nr:prepilin-type N-terminal cleavage/methylation domain-containing protein [Maridesulfovibrio sp.]